MDAISFNRHRFPPDIIRHAVWLYARLTLSYRDVEDLLAERDLDISYESVRRWFLKFGAPIALSLRPMRPTPSGYWHLDEMVIVIRGKRYLVMARDRQWRRGPGFPRAVEAERQSSVEVDAQTAEETRLGTHPDHNR